MNTNRLTTTARVIRRKIGRLLRGGKADESEPGAGLSAQRTLESVSRLKIVALAAAGVGLLAWSLYAFPPVRTLTAGEVGVRTNQFTGAVTQWRDGSVLVLPAIHDFRAYDLRDRVYKPDAIRRAGGPAPLQSVEGLSVGVDLTVRYALDGSRIATVARGLPDNMDGEIVEPAILGVAYKVFSRYTVREIFSTKRVEIQLALENEIRSKLAGDGIALRGVTIGQVDLPADYKRGMEGLLAEELETQKMRYTLELKDKRVRETELEANAEKVRREVRAEAAAREQVIAAKAQEEAMKHVLPFKQRQIEQRQLEAEAEKVSRMKTAEGAAQARRIEATGEADARRKLAEAEAFRLERLGQVGAEQMAREGALLSRHPLLIQKTLADKLSDKVQVIIAAPPADGGFIGANLLGSARVQQAAAQAAEKEE